MKKILFAVLAVAIASSTAFAGTATVGDASAGLTVGTAATSGGTTGQTTVKGSKGVIVSYNGAAQGYILGAYHTSGTQTYGTSSGDTKIFKADGTNVALPDTPPAGSNTVDFGGSFNAM